MEGHLFTNWAQTFSCRPERYFQPSNIEEIRNALKIASEKRKRVKIVGNGHSPSDIACTDDYMISLKNLNKVRHVDAEKCLIKVEAGILLNDLNERILPKHGLAMSVLGAIGDVTLGGVISTGTHGTGAQFGTLCSYIREVELITAKGKLVELSREKDEKTFLAAVLGLGALGVITCVTLQCERAFNLKDSTMPFPLDEVLENLDFHLMSADHFRFIWFPHTDGVIAQYWKRTQDVPTKTPLHYRILDWILAIIIGHHLLEVLYWISTFFTSIVPWINSFYYNFIYIWPRTRVDISYKVFNFDCLFKQYVTEWAFPRSRTGPVLCQLRDWLKANPDCRVHFPIEVRFVKQDDIYLSPAYGRDTCYINIIMYRPYGKFVPYSKYWRAFDSIALANEGRPHWAKAHKVTSKQFTSMYPKWNEFRAIREQLDPDGLFLNAYLERILSDRPLDLY